MNWEQTVDDLLEKRSSWWSMNTPWLTKPEPVLKKEKEPEPSLATILAIIMFCTGVSWIFFIAML